MYLRNVSADAVLPNGHSLLSDTCLVIRALSLLHSNILYNARRVSFT
ncbi:hypothetical protein Cyrtocomes_00010 [Candidatus Cyrtobacter comes]|uniref:Uncharacterized protein n=1 Tax=Candidatus Cyrtobacter comes TaxID=675776 RepID=A0ABU5L693_9RICK|nr:hypothetical protein [Candidatus Cyrtobacter comes]